MDKKQSEIIIYLTTFCPYCVRAKRLLNAKQVTFEEINIDEEPHKRTEMVEKSGGVTSVPIDRTPEIQCCNQFMSILKNRKDSAGNKLGCGTR